MRYILSGIAGSVIAFSLFMVMIHLIDQPEVEVPVVPPTEPLVFVGATPEPLIKPTGKVKPIEPTLQPTFVKPTIAPPTVDPKILPRPPTTVKLPKGGTGIIIGPQPPTLPPAEMTVLVSSRVKYPTRALERNLEGYVTVENTVNNLGQVVNVRIVDSSDPIFERAARNAATKWRYDQSTVGSRLHKTRIAFNLDK